MYFVRCNYCTLFGVILYFVRYDIVVCTVSIGALVPLHSPLQKCWQKWIWSCFGLGWRAKDKLVGKKKAQGATSYMLELLAS